LLSAQAWLFQTVSVSRLPINFAGSARTSDVVFKSSLNGTVQPPPQSATTYGTHGSPAAAMLLPPTGPADDLYDDDEPTKMAASGSRDGSYRRPADDLFHRRQLPDLPRIPVDSAGTLLQSNSSVNFKKVKFLLVSIVAKRLYDARMRCSSPFPRS